MDLDSGAVSAGASRRAHHLPDPAVRNGGRQIPHLQTTNQLLDRRSVPPNLRTRTSAALRRRWRRRRRNDSGPEDGNPTPRRRHSRHAANAGELPQVRRQCTKHRRERAGPEETKRPYAPSPLPSRRRRRPPYSTPYLQPGSTDPGFPHPSAAATDGEGEENRRRRRGNGGKTEFALSLASLYCSKRRGKGSLRPPNVEQPEPGLALAMNISKKEASPRNRARGPTTAQHPERTPPPTCFPSPPAPPVPTSAGLHHQFWSPPSLPDLLRPWLASLHLSSTPSDARGAASEVTDLD